MVNNTKRIVIEFILLLLIIGGIGGYLLYRKVDEGVVPEQSSSNNIISDSITASIKNSILPEQTIIDFEEIQVMDDAVFYDFNADEVTYKDGFIKGYKFSALKDQALELYAEEIGGNQSFIKTQIFDNQGNAISEEMGTHIEYMAPETNVYFFIVRTFEKRIGRTKVYILDKSQQSCMGGVRYKNGTEFFMNPEIVNSDIVGEEEVEYLYRCPDPIEVGSLGIQVWTASDPEFLRFPVEGSDSNFEIASNGGDLIEFEVTILDPNKILVAPKNGYFSTNMQVRLFIDDIWDSFFTQNIENPYDLEITKKILELEGFNMRHAYDFPDTQLYYFSWKNTDNKEVFIEGMLLYNRIGKGRDEVMELLQAEGFDKDTEQSFEERDENTGDMIYTDIYKKDDIVCKIYDKHNSFLKVYCGDTRYIVGEDDIGIN